MMLPDKGLTDFIAKHTLFSKGDTVLAAVSGGMDSVLMVHLLKSSGFKFAIAHCNFKLRGAEADADQQFCEQLAQQLGAPFHTVSFDTQYHATTQKTSIQMAARELRYQWFEQLRQQHNYTAIALAHHQNDTIETILLNLVRGTGIAGLHGILPKNGHLVRPLLFLSRQQIAHLVSENDLTYVEDSSNASTKYARNKLRHDVIPKLQELNPSLEKTFENNLQHFRDLETLLEIRVAELKHLLTIDGDEVYLQISAVKALNPQKLLLYKLLQDYGFSETSLNDVISVLDKHSGRTFESDTYKLILDRDKLIIVPKSKSTAQGVVINVDEHAAVYGNYKLTLLHDDSPLIIKDNPMAVSVDADKLIYPLQVRAWQQTDSFQPLGMKTRKKLSDFFISLKIPVHQKSQIPLLINGNGEIIWVGGHRLSDRYKVSENTKKVTIFELYKVK
ncbi:tRNA lysidine(34) synthetase TilS [Mucilaginibacter antarcticus]|uniref:tRNA(Ile)-lysidine synthase n=1 Tax=Mucilaginibacter antarcticus TaxID=1855725 RepID=A0ABW5XN01_9SPHI